MDIISQITREIKHLNSDPIANSLAIRILKSAKADLLNIEAQDRPIQESGPMVGWAFLSAEERINAEMDRDDEIDGVLHR